MAHSRSFLANQRARNAIIGAENILITLIEISYISIQNLPQISKHKRKKHNLVTENSQFKIISAIVQLAQIKSKKQIRIRPRKPMGAQ